MHINVGNLIATLKRMLNHCLQAHLPPEYRLWKVVLYYKPASDGRLTLMYR